MKEYPLKVKVGKARLAKGNYTTPTRTKACDKKRRNCPVQLVFVDGQSYVKLCGKEDSMTSVDTGEEAMKASRKLCKDRG